MAEVQIPHHLGALLGGDLLPLIIRAFPDDRNVRLWCRAARTARDASQTALKVGRCMAWGPSDPSGMPLYRREDINCSYVLGAIRRGCRPASFSLRGKYTHHQHTDTDGLKHARMLELVQFIPGALPPGSPPLPTTHLELHASVLSAGPAMAHAIAAAFPNLTHITLQAANVLTGARADAPAAAECLLHLLSSDPPPLPPPPPANPDPDVAMDADNQATPAADAAPLPAPVLPVVPHAGPLLPHLTSLTVDTPSGLPAMLHTALLAAPHIRELRCCRFDPTLRQPYALPNLGWYQQQLMMPANTLRQQITQLEHLTSLRIETNAGLLMGEPGQEQQEAVALVHILSAHLPGLRRLELPQCAGPLCVNDFAGLVHLRHLSAPWLILGTQGLAAQGPLEFLTSLEVRALGAERTGDMDAQAAALLAPGGGGAVQAAGGGAAAPAAAAAPLPRLQRLVVYEARMQSPLVLARFWGHTCLRQLTMWINNAPTKALVHSRARAGVRTDEQEAEDRAGGVGGIPLLAFSRREVSHGRLTAVGEVALGRCAELLAGVQQRAGGAVSREIELRVELGVLQREGQGMLPGGWIVEAGHDIMPGALAAPLGPAGGGGGAAGGPGGGAVVAAGVLGRHASWLSRLSGVRGLVRLRMCGLDLAHGDLQALAAGVQDLQALRLDGCLFPTASLPVLAALRRLHTLTLDVGCWWGHSLTSKRSAGVAWLDLILDNPMHPGGQHGEDGGALGAPDRGPVPTSDPQFLLHEAPWRLGNLCIMADQLQRVELWEGGLQLLDDDSEEDEEEDSEHEERGGRPMAGMEEADDPIGGDDGGGNGGGGGGGGGGARAAAVRAVCHSANQLLLQAIEQGNVRLAVRAPVVEWAPPKDI